VKPAEKIVAICKQLNAKNYLAAADGNISYRLSDNRILITPSGVNKSTLTPELMCEMTLDGQAITGKPSSEKLMHLSIYRHCPQAKAVVHAHPPTAIAWSIAQPDLKELPGECMSELILASGRIPFVPYARPGTQQMGDVIIPFLPQSRLLILSRHGALSWGEDLDEAYNGMERLEHSAVILKTAMELGGITNLPEEEIAILRQMRERMGDRTL